MSNIRPGRVWFLVGFAPLLLGAALGLHFYGAMKHGIVDMQRVVVPGEADLQLGQGEYVLYGESRSVVDGTAYVNDSFSARCAVLDVESDTQVALTSPTGSTTYTGFGYAGQSMFELDVPHAGTYRLHCEGDDAPAVIAVGRGIGTSIILLVVSILGGVIGFIAIMATVANRRFRARRALPPEYPAPPGAAQRAQPASSTVPVASAPPPIS
jgi:hypothetical protein